MRFSNAPLLDLRRTFRKPPHGNVRKASLLVLLRGDLQSLYGPEASIGGHVAAPLLAALGIYSGLQLLSKYWFGEALTSQRQVCEFLTAAAGLTKSDAETLLQFRNSLAHNYGLTTRRRPDQKKFSFALDTSAAEGAALVRALGSGDYVVNLWSLKRLFVLAIGHCRIALAKDPIRLGKFQVCIRNLGEIAVTA